MSRRNRPRTELSRAQRKLRRRSWWRSGGPLWWLRPDRTGCSGSAAAPAGGSPAAGTASSPALPPELPDPLLEVVTWAEWLSAQRRFDEARQVVSEALVTHGRHPQLVRCAAAVEDDADAIDTALFLYREAHRADPADVDVVCGLAVLLAGTLAAPDGVLRTDDALRVLDAFHDQNHPKIRNARVEVLRERDAALARVVAAYGGRRGLSADAARTRRRLWLRSGGPLGQLLVIVADWRRGRLLTADQGGRPVRRTEAESEDLARLYDSLKGKPASAARERLDEAIARHGRTPSLLVRHAEFDLEDGASWQALACAAEAFRADQESLDRALWLAHGVDGASDTGRCCRSSKACRRACATPRNTEYS